MNVLVTVAGLEAAVVVGCPPVVDLALSFCVDEVVVLRGPVCCYVLLLF